MEEKICRKCNLPKPASDFHKNRSIADGLNSYCKPCCRIASDERHAANPERRAEIMRKHKSGVGWKNNIVHHARYRAKVRGVICTITADDFSIPEFCPILGMPLVYGRGNSGPDSATLDRIDPNKGYVRGNVQVISRRANMMKSDASPAELLKFAAWVNHQFGGHDQILATESCQEERP